VTVIQSKNVKIRIETSNSLNSLTYLAEKQIIAEATAAIETIEINKLHEMLGDMCRKNQQK
jgi:hypothetical protein